MTPLEKCARALAGRKGYDWDLCPLVTRDELKAEARTVLEAIRVSDDKTAWVGADIIQGPVGGSAKTAALECFAGMIDHILSQ